MPRKPLLRSQVFAYHVTGRANNREAFHCGLRMTWQILAGQAYEVTVLFGARVHALVVMPNHFHLLLSTPADPLDRIMKHWMESATRTINALSGRSGHVFGGRYHRSVIQEPVYFATVFKYVYRNPVRAGLCARVEDYEASTLHGQLGLSRLEVPLQVPHPGLGKPMELAGLPEWLNKPFRKENEAAIRAGLWKTRFRPPGEDWEQRLECLREELF